MLDFGRSASKEIGMREFAVAVLGAALLWAAPAGATNCRDWERAYPAAKTEIVEDMIESAISGQKGRQRTQDGH